MGILDMNKIESKLNLTVVILGIIAIGWSFLYLAEAISAKEWLIPAVLIPLAQLFLIDLNKQIKKFFI